jgi:acyl-CoA dehydrogenase
MRMVTSALVMGIADGPTEVHKVTLARQILKDYQPDNDLFPAYHIPKLQDEAKARFGKELADLKAAYAQRRSAETA